jgi:hypothetical protein
MTEFHEKELRKLLMEDCQKANIVSELFGMNLGDDDEDSDDYAYMYGNVCESDEDYNRDGLSRACYPDLCDDIDSEYYNGGY